MLGSTSGHSIGLNQCWENGLPRRILPSRPLENAVQARSRDGGIPHDESRNCPPVGQGFSLRPKLGEIRNRNMFFQISWWRITLMGKGGGNCMGWESGLSPACKDWGSLDDGVPVAKRNGVSDSAPF